MNSSLLHAIVLQILIALLAWPLAPCWLTSVQLRSTRAAMSNDGTTNPMHAARRGRGLSRFVTDADPEKWKATMKAINDMELKDLVVAIRALEEDKRTADEANRKGQATDGAMRRLQSRYVEILDAFAERVEKGVKGCKDMDQKPPHSVGERERLYRWALRFDSSLEISNKLGDILFLIFALRDHKVLFWMSLAALGLALLLRILIGLKSWPRVGHDEKKKWTYRKKEQHARPKKETKDIHK